MKTIFTLTTKCGQISLHASLEDAQTFAGYPIDNWKFNGAFHYINGTARIKETDFDRVCLQTDGNLFLISD